MARKPKSPTKAKSGTKAKAKAKQRPIKLYYWPTPNGWKISIMLEECALPYTMIPVNIAKGDQFEPEFLKISPNNRMPAIVDPDGPGARPISIFESGAILQYLGRKTGKFYPADERGRVEVDQWLMWQMGGLGPMAGQAHHFRIYAPEKLPYAIARYTDECNRLYGVMNTRLKHRPFLAGRYSIADIACVGWASRHERQGQNFGQFPHLKRWLDTILARSAVKRGMKLRVEEASKVDLRDPKVQAVLFGQRARGNTTPAHCRGMVSWPARDKVSELSPAGKKAALPAGFRIIDGSPALRPKTFRFDSLRRLKHHSNFVGKDRAGANPVITKGTRGAGE